ncbi:uncharacterized protein F4822DRAFT_416741 [Hypoxylon trugodes]|uniref:uncharacterized protein n=1 Tax=Hypoxylon trugodes TaxID=326681 RepID=UPI00219485E0|nr:uncharacterized protein F4822DRAFT_416741 [Hypoxylon trugodes]KAI1384936.1 hypothetical protein F4822DRAFT_416741 [Hypoxylon trugodes]
MNFTLEKSGLATAHDSHEDDYVWRKSLGGSSDDDTLLTQDTRKFKQRKSFWRRHVRAIYVHIVLFSLYCITVITLVAWNSSLRKEILFSPANEVLKWNTGPWPEGDGLTEPYVGYPRPELEKAWEGLLKNMNIRISKEDVRRFGREETAIPLPDGSGYIGTLNVYHEIHCIRWLHKHLYQEIYWPQLDDIQREKNRVHSEHCLSTLRKFAICHGDVGLITYSWNPHHVKPTARATEHRCIDWDRFSNWTAERAVNMFEPGYLVHPSLGPAYPDGEPLHGGPRYEEHTLPPVPPEQ